MVWHSPAQHGGHSCEPGVNVKISIVTISFNQAEFLERTIRSVLEQDYPAIEYIVVDPGSTDGSREILARYADRVKLILEKDAGPADGLNKGFAAATGDIFGYVNADDVLLPGAIGEAVRYLETHPAVDVVSGDARVIGPRDELLRLAFSDRMWVRGYIYGAVVLIQPSSFFRRAAYELAGPFNVNNRSTWDGELFLRMAARGARFARSHRVWSGFRLHGNSITASKKMADNAAAQHLRLFREIAGREPNALDGLAGRALQLWKHLVNPRDTAERILKGPVYGRSVK